MATAADAETPKNPRTPGRGAFRSFARSLRQVESRTVAIVAIVALLIYLVIGPVAMLVLSSFRETTGQLPIGDVPWTIGNYAQVLTSPRTYSVLSNTFVFAIGSLFLSFALSITFAWLIERTDLPLRNVLFVVIIASIGIPNVIAGIAYALLMNPSNGLLNIVLRPLLGMEPTAGGPLNVYTLAGMIFVQGITLVPITFLLVAAAFRAMDTALEDAGSTSGAAGRTVMRRITLPLLTPALLSAFVYQFVTVIESFDIPLVLGLRGGIPVLSTQVFIEARPSGGLPDYGLASTYAMLLLVLALGPLLFYNRVIGRSERYATITGHSYMPRRMRLGGWKLPAVLLSVSFIMISFILPGLVMLWTSLQPFYAVPSLESIARISLDAYEQVLTSRRMHQALGNTLLLGFATGFGAMLIGLFVSWVLVRTKSRFRFLLDVLAFTPHAMPGVLIGISVLLIYLILPLPIWGTIWIIVIALGTQYISIATRLMTSGITQIKNELEEAAAVSGAAWWPSIRRIVLPLVLPAFLNGFLLVFLLAIKNLTLALILFTPDSIVMSTLVWSLWDRADTAGTAAVGSIMVAITLALSIVIRRINRQGPQLT